MSKSKPFLEKDYKGASMLLPLYLQMRDNLDLNVEYDMLGQLIITQYGIVTIEVLVAVIDEVFDEIAADETIVLDPRPEFHLHFAMHHMIREAPFSVDPLFWQYPLAVRVVAYLAAQIFD